MSILSAEFKLCTQPCSSRAKLSLRLNCCLGLILSSEAISKGISIDSHSPNHPPTTTGFHGNQRYYKSGDLFLFLFYFWRRNFALSCCQMCLLFAIINNISLPLCISKLYFITNDTLVRTLLNMWLQYFGNASQLNLNSLKRL